MYIMATTAKLSAASMLFAIPLSASFPPLTLPTPVTTASPRGEVFDNPIITGFSPDPSLCRVGDDFYLVCSSFEYFPGVPIYHSRDLVNWEMIGYCLTRESQLPLGDCVSSSGIYAPTLRFHDGTFYMITTNFASKGTFYVTAKDPRGPWSEPIWLGNNNADPSLLFDDDGRIYMVQPDGGGAIGFIHLMEIDPQTGEYKAGQQLPGKLIWAGTGGEYPEGPHLHKIDGMYYLMIAEGGTGYEHRETIARSSSPWGPYFAYENNPILTHRDLPDNPIGATGHADMVRLKDGSWWAVCLAERMKNAESHLGRETFLLPVEWTKDGWPIFGESRRAKLEGPGPNLPRYSFPRKPPRDDFSSAAPELEWNYIRNPDPSRYSLCERPGWLRLKGGAATFDDHRSPTALLRRQRHFDVEFAAFMDFAPVRDGDEAGLVLRQTDSIHAEFCVVSKNGANHLVLRLTEPTGKSIVYDRPAPRGPFLLRVTADRDRYHFRCGGAGGTEIDAGDFATSRLSVEVAGRNNQMCFTGMMIGVYATGNGADAASPADFDWFDYRPSTDCR